MPIYRWKGKILRKPSGIGIAEECCCPDTPCNESRCDCGRGDFTTGDPCRLPDEILLRKKVGDFKDCGGICADLVDDDWNFNGGDIGGPGIPIPKIDTCCTFEITTISGCVGGTLTPTPVRLIATCQKIGDVCGIKIRMEYVDGIWEGWPINPASNAWQTLFLIQPLSTCNSPTEMEIKMNWGA